MKILINVLLLVILTGFVGAYGQESWYDVNGESRPGRLVGISPKKVVFARLVGDHTIRYPLNRENILVVFNQSGRFMALMELSRDTTQAWAQINEFYDPATPKPRQNVLVKMNPITVLPGIIQSEQGDAIRYITDKGDAITVDKKEVLVVLRTDGSHTLYKPAAEATVLLVNVRSKIEEFLAPKPPNRPLPTATSAAPANPPALSEKPKPADSPIKEKPLTARERPVTPQENGLNKVSTLSECLKLIIDKNIDSDVKDRAIEQATQLFLPEAIVEQTSMNPPGTIRKYRIRDYFTRLKLLSHKSVRIDWLEIKYISDLQPGEDGDYYGLLAGKQILRGNSSDGKTTAYTDLSHLNTRVKVQTYRKITNGKEHIRYEALLGNIGIGVN